MAIRVKIPLLSSSFDTNIFVYYGNAGANELVNQDPYSLNLKGFWDMGQDPSGGTGSILDRTSSANHGTPNGEINFSNVVDGQIGKSLDFDGVNEYIDIGTLGNFGSLLNEITTSFWIKSVDTGNGRKAIIKQINNGSSTVFGIEPNRAISVGTSLVDSPGKTLFYLRDNSGSGILAGHVGTSIYDDRWHYVVWRVVDASSNDMEVYVDGVLQSFEKTIYQSPRTWANLNQGIYIGASNNRGNPQGHLEGSIDDIRIYSTALSPEKISIIYANESDPATFYTVGAEEMQNLGTETPSISVDISSYDFGSFTIGAQFLSQVFTLKNTGSADLIVGVLSLGGVDATDFSLQSDTCSEQTLMASASCTVSVLFSPTVTGLKSGELHVLNNDPDTPDLLISLTGEATGGSSGGGSSLWSSAETILFYTLGNVGIGIEDPLALFHVAGTMLLERLQIADLGGDAISWNLSETLQNALQISYGAIHALEITPTGDLKISGNITSEGDICIGQCL